jgi:hypothetical protein
LLVSPEIKQKKKLSVKKTSIKQVSKF